MAQNLMSDHLVSGRREERSDAAIQGLIVLPDAENGF